MKSLIHKVTAIAMATLVLFTTMSFTVNMHFCGDSLVDFALLETAHSCGMEVEQPAEDCEVAISDDSCCTDKQVVFEGQDELKFSVDSLNFEQQVFVATFFYTYINLFEGLDANVVPFRNYKPPLLIRDIQKLHETYLI